MSTITTRAVKGSALTHAEVDANFTNLGNSLPDGAIQTATPTTGTTVTVANATSSLILKHTATIATLTITMPASPSNGQLVHISTRSTVTTLTVNGNAGQTLYGAPSTIAATTPVAFIYETAAASWYRI
ncbi:MAG: hypothetical protein ACO242_02380 [Candidatus Fonsibacter ubiquis]